MYCFCLIRNLVSRHVSGHLPSPWCSSFPRTVEQQSLGHPSSERNRLCSTPSLLASPLVPCFRPPKGLRLRPPAGLALARLSAGQPTPIPAIARSGATDQGSAHPDCNAARLRYDIEENSQHQEPGGPRGRAPRLTADRDLQGKTRGPAVAPTRACRRAGHARACRRAGHARACQRGAASDGDDPPVSRGHRFAKAPGSRGRPGTLPQDHRRPDRR